VEYVSRNQNGESLVKELGSRLAGKRVLVPRSDRGDERLSNALRAAGAELTEVIAYRTTAPVTMDLGLLARVSGGGVDAVIFSSPSAFHTFLDCLGQGAAVNLSTWMHFAAIGPTTANAIRGAGARVEIEAAEPSASALANAVAMYYQRQAARVRPA